MILKIKVVEVFIMRKAKNMENSKTTKDKTNVLKNFFQSNKKKLLLCLVILVVIVSIAITVLCFNKPDDKMEMCQVQFNVNGGTQINSLDIECGTKISEPIQPNKDGFDFIGWYIEDYIVDFDKLTINENLILEAKWKVRENVEIVTVKFDTQGGNEITDIELAKGAKLTPPLNPQKEGFVFKYWSYNNQRFDFINEITEDITLVAIWESESKTNHNSGGSNSSNANSNNTTSSIDSCTYEIKNLDSEYNGKIPEWQLGLDLNEQFSSFFGFWSYNPNGCNIVYKVDNSNIASVSQTGIVTGKNLGSTYLNICVVDKTSQKELDCFKWKINVRYQHDSERAIKDTNNLVNAINGYYWYLDGYEYAFIKADNINWYDHKALSWSSKYIELENNKFITTEDTGNVYKYTSTNIHNKFLINPTEYAYTLIADYNMRVTSNKLYITLDNKTYSFTKHNTEKVVKANLDVKSKNLTVSKDSFFSLNVDISPSYADYKINVDSSNESVLSNCSISDKTIKCYANKSGNSTLTIKDINGATIKVNVTVENVKVSGIFLNETLINLDRGENEQLYATITPDNATNKNVQWSSSEPSIVTVDNNGKVTAKKRGTAIITVMSTDGGYTASCTVNVTNPPLTAQGSIGIKILTSSGGTTQGVYAEIIGSGGTGIYTYYYIELYKDGVFIGKTTDTSHNSLFLSGYSNGNYTMQYELRDSDGTVITGSTSATISGF